MVATTQRNILMVGNQATEVPDLCQAMPSVAPRWDWQLATTGMAALDALTREEFDAVVTDMRLDDLSGLQLLNQVMSQWPKAHRIILADPGELDALLRCVGGLHQFLARPCEAKRLSTMLSRAFRLDLWLPNVTVRRLLGRLPTLPSAAPDYHATIDDLERGRLDAAAARIETDPAMAAKILQLANSAAYGPPLDEANARRAATELGLANRRHTVLLAHTYSEFRDLKAAGFDVTVFVDHARKTSRVARRIAEMEAATEAAADQAALAGLLHNLGKLALAVNLPDKQVEVSSLLKQGQKTGWEAEQEVFGATHGEVGGSLLALWGLPMQVIEAVAFHHHPACFLSQSFSPLTAVHVANVMVNATSLEQARERLDLRYLATVQAEDHLADWWSAREAGLDSGTQS